MTSRTSLQGSLPVVLGFVIPFAGGGHPPWPMASVSLLAAAALFSIGGKGTGAEPARTVGGPLWIPLLGALILAAGHLPGSPVPYSSILFIAQFTIAMAVFWLASEAASQVSSGTQVAVWLIATLPLAALEAILNPTQTPAGPFGNPNYLGAFLLSCLGFCIGALVTRTARTRQGTLLGGAALCTAALAVLGSRSAGLGALLLWGALFVLRKDWWRWMAPAVVLALLVMPSTLRFRVTEGYRQDPHAFSRVHIWKAALKMGADHPVAGVGPNLFFENGPVYAFPIEGLPVRYGRIARSAHSEYLRAWAEGGALGAVLLALFLILSGKAMVGAWREGRQGPVLAVLALFFSAAFHDLTESFALTLLLAWWMGRIVLRSSFKDVIHARMMRTARYVLASVCLISAAWLGSDAAGRLFWQRGQEAMALDPDPARAVALLDKACRVDALLPGAARDLGEARLMVARRTGLAADWERASAAISRAISLNRLDSVPLRLQAALLTDLAGGKAGPALAEAARLLKRASAIEPHNALILANLAKVQFDMGAAREALATIDRALAEEPNYVYAHRLERDFYKELDLGPVSRGDQGDPIPVEPGTPIKPGTPIPSADYRPFNAYEAAILNSEQ